MESNNYLTDEQKALFKENLLKEKIKFTYKLALILGLNPDEVNIQNVSIPEDGPDWIKKNFQSLIYNLQAIENIKGS